MFASFLLLVLLHCGYFVIPADRPFDQSSHWAAEISATWLNWHNQFCPIFVKFFQTRPRIANEGVNHLKRLKTWFSSLAFLKWQWEGTCYSCHRYPQPDTFKIRSPEIASAYMLTLLPFYGFTYPKFHNMILHLLNSRLTCAWACACAHIGCALATWTHDVQEEDRKASERVERNKTGWGRLSQRWLHQWRSLEARLNLTCKTQGALPSPWWSRGNGKRIEKGDQ